MQFLGGLRPNMRKEIIAHERMSRLARRTTGHANITLRPAAQSRSTVAQGAAQSGVLHYKRLWSRGHGLKDTVPDHSLKLTWLVLGEDQAARSHRVEQLTAL